MGFDESDHVGEAHGFAHGEFSAEDRVDDVFGDVLGDGGWFSVEAILEDASHGHGRHALGVFDDDFDLEFAVVVEFGEGEDFGLAGGDAVGFGVGRGVFVGGGLDEFVSELNEILNAICPFWIKGQIVESFLDFWGEGHAYGRSMGTPTLLPHSVQLPS